VPVFFRRVFVQREADITRKTVVDDRNLLWKTNLKFFFFGLTLASINVGTAALDCPKKVCPNKKRRSIQFEVGFFAQKVNRR
jgi:hypothetical protein